MNYPSDPNDNPFAAPEALLTPDADRADDPIAPHLASIGWRILAFAIDWLLIVSLLNGVLAVVMVVLGYRLSDSFSPPVHARALVDKVSYFQVLIIALYFAVQESSRWQATLGKKVVRLKVVRLKVPRVSFGLALVRIGLWYIGCAILFLGLMPALFTRRRQAIHDMITGTLAVRDSYDGPTSDV